MQSILLGLISFKSCLLLQGLHIRSLSDNFLFLYWEAYPYLQPCDGFSYTS